MINGKRNTRKCRPLLRRLDHRTRMGKTRLHRMKWRDIAHTPHNYCRQYIPLLASYRRDSSQIKTRISTNESIRHASCATPVTLYRSTWTDHEVVNLENRCSTCWKFMNQTTTRALLQCKRSCRPWPEVALVQKDQGYVWFEPQVTPPIFWHDQHKGMTNILVKGCCLVCCQRTAQNVGKVVCCLVCNQLKNNFKI
jgi:hypothetical protein